MLHALFKAVLCVVFSANGGLPYDSDSFLRDILEYIKNAPEQQKPSEEIYFDGEAVFCTGKTKIAEENNKAAALILERKYKEAADVLYAALANSPLFFPYRYNLGLCHLHLDELDKSLLHFTKAGQLIPQFAGVYLQTGYIHCRKRRYMEAIADFKAAVRLNRRELNALVLIGDVFYANGEFGVAKKYYDAPLTVEADFPNALLGKAKLLFAQKEYFKAIEEIKKINLSGEYDKALHFYYAESAYKISDYKTAEEQYLELLKYPADKFFMTVSQSTIEQKINACRQAVSKEKLFDNEP
jgi:tetratricopeptide (TPR) repeat protein